MERRPYLNPHKDAELQRGKAADRFEAGPSTVKAARIEPVVTRALGAGAWQSFKDWTSLQGNPSPYGTYGKERYRPPPISIMPSGLSPASRGAPFPAFDHLPHFPYYMIPGLPHDLVQHSNVGGVYTNDWGARSRDPRYSEAYESSNRDSLAYEFDVGPPHYMSVDDAHQEWNSYNASNASTS